MNEDSPHTSAAPGAPAAGPSDDALERFLHAMPKVEIHCHLLGTVRHATF